MYIVFLQLSHPHSVCRIDEYTHIFLNVHFYKILCDITCSKLYMFFQGTDKALSKVLSPFFQVISIVWYHLDVALRYHTSKGGFPVWSTGIYVWEDVIPHMMAGILMEDWSMHLVYICHMHKDDTKTFNYTAITDRLKMLSWSDNSHPIGVVKRFKGSPSHFWQQLCNPGH